MAKKKQKEEPAASTYRKMSENWKTLLAQGAFALALGVVILVIPDATARVVAILLGIFLVVYGVLSAISARSAQQEEEPSAWLYARGGLAIAGGAVVIFWPSLRNEGLAYILGIFAIAVGLIIGGLGLFAKWDGIMKSIAALGGVLSIAFGVVTMLEAESFADSIVQITGVYAIALGILLVLLAFGTRGASGSGG